jgi:hypothetical protein
VRRENIKIVFDLSQFIILPPPHPKMDVSKFRSDVQTATGLGGGEIRKPDERREGTFDRFGTVTNTHITCHKVSTKKNTWKT